MPKTRTALNPGPLAYQNWKAFEREMPTRLAWEHPCYTDAQIVGEARVGPYSLIDAGRWDRTPDVPAMVLRIEDHLPWRGLLSRAREKQENEHYHGGLLSDELAALTSLELGIRLQAGAANRRFDFEEGADPRGRPVSDGRHQQVEPIPPGEVPSPVIPSLRRDHVELNVRLIARLASLDVHSANTLTRCARSYQDAVWIAETAPHLSWLLLVSSVEAAMNHWNAGDGDPYERVASSQNPLVRAIREEGGDELLRRLAPQVAVYTGAGKKFVDFLLAFGPKEPLKTDTGRVLAPLWGRLDWTEEALRKTYRRVYTLRSEALHSARPMPLPMCVAPSGFHSKEVIEIPTVTGSHGASWDLKNVPILLSTFERITREALLAYWLANSAEAEL